MNRKYAKWSKMTSEQWSICSRVLLICKPKWLLLERATDAVWCPVSRVLRFIPNTAAAFTSRAAAVSAIIAGNVEGVRSTWFERWRRLGGWKMRCNCVKKVMDEEQLVESLWPYPQINRTCTETPRWAACCYCYCRCCFCYMLLLLLLLALSHARALIGDVMDDGNESLTLI